MTLDLAHATGRLPAAQRLRTAGVRAVARKAGVMGVVTESGVAGPGDVIEVEQPDGPHRPLGRV